MSPVIWLVALNIVQKLIWLPSDGIFHLGECKMLIPGQEGRRAVCYSWSMSIFYFFYFFTNSFGERVGWGPQNIVHCETALNQRVKMAGQRRWSDERVR